MKGLAARIFWGLLICSWIAILALPAQAQEPLPWEAPAPIAPLKIYAELSEPRLHPGEEVTLLIHGQIPAGWHIYSVKSQGEHGPLITRLVYTVPSFQPLSPLEESPPEVIYDQALKTHLAVHTQSFTLQQKLRLSSSGVNPGAQELGARLEYQICDNQICAPLQKHLLAVPFFVEAP